MRGITTAERRATKITTAERCATKITTEERCATMVYSGGAPILAPTYSW